VELSDKTLGIIGLGRIGKLVAQRASSFGMRLVAYDPFVSDDRARQMNVTLVDLDTLMAQSDFVTLHLAKTPETVGLIGTELLARSKPGIRIVNVARGGIVDEAALAAAIESGHVAGAALDVFAEEPCTESPLFALDAVVATPHLGASTVEAQDKAGDTIADQVSLALRGEFVPYAVNVSAAEASETVRPFLPLAERLGQLTAGLAEGAATDLELEYQGQIGDYDTRILTLSVLKGYFGASSDQPVSYVNAPQIAKEQGIAVRETSTSTSHDYVNLITVRGGGRSVAGTLVGLSGQPRLVMVDEHTVDVPPADHMLVIRNEDRPGVIGIVGTILGDAGVNIADMDVGLGPSGESALMLIATSSPAPRDVVDRLRAADGIVSVHAVEQ
jgi:D-3-phosphoglycerate dehydrogenase